MAVATAYHPARNADASPYVYTVHPEDLVRIVLAIEDAGEDLVAIFHSHTHTPAEPSPTDRRQAMYPDAIYLLATLMDDDAAPAESLRAWRIRDGEATEVPLRIGTSRWVRYTWHRCSHFLNRSIARDSKPPPPKRRAGTWTPCLSPRHRTTCTCSGTTRPRSSA